MVSEVPLTEDDLAGAALSHWSMLAKTCGLSADLPAREVLLARKETHGPKVVRQQQVPFDKTQARQDAIAPDGA